VKKYFFIPAIVLIVLCIYLPVNTNAQTSTKIIVYPTADSYVDSSNPDTNFGTSTTLNVSANTIQTNSYMKFDLSGIPLDATILSATLEVNLATDIGLIYKDDRISVYYCQDNSWGEQTITWNNRPATASSPTSVWTIPIIFYTGYHAWDVTQDAKTALQSRGLTEVIKFTEKYGDGCMVFKSKDGGTSPKLEIEYIPAGGVTPTPLVTPTPTPVPPTPTVTVAPPTATPYVSPPTATPTPTPTASSTPSLTPTTTPNPAIPTPTIITPTPKTPTPSPSIPEYSVIIAVPLLISLLALAFILRLKRKS
jgi:hypothetical protein